MGRKQSQAAVKKKAPDTLLEKGLSMLALGVAFLLLPAFIGKSAIAAPFAAGLRIPAIT